MGEVLFNSFVFLIIIALGYFLKRCGILKKSDGDTLASIVMNLTLPAALLTGSAGISITSELVIFIFLGFAVNVIMIIMSAVAFRKKDPLTRGVYMLSSTGIDAGDSVLPFIQTFFPGAGVVALCTFNIGNTIMNCGFNYIAAIKVSSNGEKFGIKDMCGKLFKNVLFDTYIAIILMAVFHFEWPEHLLKITSVIGDANIFIVMMMIGLKLEFGFTKGEVREIGKITALRLAAGVIMTAITWLLPVSRIGKIVLTCSYFGSPAAVANVFSIKLGYKGSLTSQMYFISFFLGIIIITGILLLFI
ncbi:MAG: AEC family transporter [Lachnospiraceae bacterium]|jgi:predicted permease